MERRQHHPGGATVFPPVIFTDRHSRMSRSRIRIHMLILIGNLIRSKKPWTPSSHPSSPSSRTISVSFPTPSVCWSSWMFLIGWHTTVQVLHAQHSHLCPHQHHHVDHTQYTTDTFLTHRAPRTRKTLICCLCGASSAEVWLCPILPRQTPMLPVHG